MKFILGLIAFGLAAFTACPAGPVPGAVPFADEAAERQSVDGNEVGPAEDWNLLRRLTKTNTFDPSDSEKTRTLIKEIEQFTRLVKQSNVTDDGDAADTTTTGLPPQLWDDGDGDSTAIGVTEADPASSDWFGATWRNGDGGLSERQASDGDGGNVEEIIRKLSNDLKKLYVKIKQVITVVKNWVNNARGQRNEFDESSTISASSSDSDGVFVIADPLIGDVDKSNKYTVPIYAD